MGAETVGWLQGIIGKHAKVLQSMCQQHAGSGCLARIEMCEGLGRRGLSPKTIFKAKLFQWSSIKIPPSLDGVEGGKAQMSFTLTGL